MTNSFVSLPLDKLMNRQNIVSRLERVESLAGAHPSARILSLSELGGALSMGGSNLYVDPNGLILLSREYPSYDYIKWISDVDSAKTAELRSFYITGGAAGVEIIGYEKDTGTFGRAAITGKSNDDVNYTVLNVDSHDGATLDIRNAENTASGQQNLIIQTQVSSASTDNNSVNPVLYMDSYTAGTPAAGFGTALVFRAEDSSSDMESIGYIGAKYTDPTSGSEDSELVIGWRVAGAQVDGGLISGTWTPTATAGTNIAASTDIIAQTCNYIRVGNQVSFNGSVQIDTTAIGAFTCYLTLPIASNFDSNFDANGIGSQPGTGVPNIFNIREDQVNDRLQLDGYAQVSTNLFYRFTGGYIIK